MQWNEIRERFPEEWLLVEAVEAHSAEGQRILDDIAVIQFFPDSAAAWESYKKLHRKWPLREFLILHTSREHLDIGEIVWLGIRTAS